MEPVIAVLAGGASARMGTDKAHVTVDGTAMLDIVAGAAASVGEVVVVGADPPIRWTFIEDARSGRQGPLAGLETALVYAAGRDVVLVAVDQPFVRPDTLRRLLDVAGDAVVPVDGGWDQVTCAVYREPCLSAARHALETESGRSLQGLIGVVETTRVDPAAWQTWGEDGRSWYSVDTPAALDEGLRRWGPRS
jgi:molybdopterin-guanine dinucleotide biosynthesis protein A